MNNELGKGINYESVIIKDFTIPMVDTNNTNGGEVGYIVNGQPHEINSIYEEIEKDYAYIAEDYTLEEMKMKGLFYKYEDMDRERLQSIYEKIIQSFMYTVNCTVDYYFGERVKETNLFLCRASEKVYDHIIKNNSLVDKILDIAYLMNLRLPDGGAMSTIDLNYSIMTAVDQCISSLHSVMHSELVKTQVVDIIDPILFANIMESLITPFKILHDNLLYYVLTMANEIYINRYGVFNHGEENNI